MPKEIKINDRFTNCRLIVRKEFDTIPRNKKSMPIKAKFVFFVLLIKYSLTIEAKVAKENHANNPNTPPCGMVAISSSLICKITN